MRFVRALLLAVVLFPAGLATHEVMHLAVYSALGVPAVLVVTSWKLGAAAVPIWGLHAAPAGTGATVPLRTLLLNNALGPTLAALPLLALLASIHRRSRAARAALLANALALLFFAVVELAYPLLEEVAHVDADVLLLPELNYGAVLLILVATTALATSAGGMRRRRERAPSVGSPAEAS
ncbi:MAG TPA: hypothetical protein VLW53_22345 [Candidatus Eisenbacteria bacterium]|nr:hypothetical protein [Candidatus Eisenbacteria bacterium]